MMDACRRHGHIRVCAARLALVVVTALVLSAGMAWGQDFAGGTGEPNDPYLIATADQLLAADFTVPETYFRLCNDIDLDRKAGPLGYFHAHLDGAGFEIQHDVHRTV